MNILIISSSNFHSTYGGGQVYVKNIVDEMLLQGMGLVIGMPGEKTEKAKPYRGADVFAFADKIINNNLDQLKIFISNIKPDVVHAHGYKAAFAKACKELGIPCLVTAHHGGILCPAGALLNHKDEICTIKANAKDCLPCVLKNTTMGIYSWPILKIIPAKFRILLGRWLQKLPFIFYVTPTLCSSLNIYNKNKEWESIYKNANLIVAPSHSIAASMILNGASKELIKVIPHGIPINIKYSEANLIEFSVKDKKRMKFFFVGRICHEKGVHIMLEAFNQINSDAELHIIGGTGNKAEERYASKLQRKYQQNKKIVWHGKVPKEEVNEIIAYFDIMVHPTICLEVFGLNISEALALGKPVIATKCGGSEMQITHGVNGFLVQPNDVNDLKKSIKKFIKNQELFSETDENKWSNIVSIKQHVKELNNCYKSVLA